MQTLVEEPTPPQWKVALRFRSTPYWLDAVGGLEQVPRLLLAFLRW